MPCADGGYSVLRSSAGEDTGVRGGERTQEELGCRESVQYGNVLSVAKINEYFYA
jgi:hypothetical protein